jgi:hypothetical protein
MSINKRELIKTADVFMSIVLCSNPVEIFLHRFAKDVLVRPPEGRPQRAKPYIKRVFHLHG